MKNRKASRAMEYLDDKLIEDAMDASDWGTGAAEVRARTTNERRSTTLKYTFTKWIAVAAAFILVATAALVAVPVLAGGSDTIIALDVNPSIEIEINKKEEIKEVRALNAEGEIVIGQMDFKGVDLEIGINAIIGSMLKNGYLSTDQNSILISIDSKNQEKAAALKEKLTGEIDALLGGSNISASVLTQDFDRGDESARADENHISPAKAALISKIVSAGLLDANGVPYTYEELSLLKVNDLKLILESRDITVDGLNATGTASDSRYMTKEAAMAIALEKAGVIEADILREKVEMDFDDDYIVDGKRGCMVYEVEFHTSEKKYEYEIHAVSGEILDEEIKNNGSKGDQNGASDESTPPASEPTETTPAGEETFSPTGQYIDRNEALAIAYADAGVTADEVRRPEIETDREKGIEVYEIEFKTDKKEYEYTINAATGKILEREIEPRD